MASPRTLQALARLADLTPRQIVAELDRYIVGQADAKKAVAIALRNRWRRQQAPEAAEHALGRHVRSRDDARHLSRSVDARVRASGPVDPPVLPVAEARQRVFQDPLDRPFPRIDLEAGKVRSVVFDRSAIAHGGGLSDA